MSNTSPAPKIINTNPFVRAFNGLDLLFKHNQAMAIILLVISLFWGVVQFAGNIFDSSDQPTRSIPATGEPINVAALLAVVVPIILVVIAAAVVIATYMNGLTNYVAWKTSQRQTTTFMEAMQAVTKRFWTLLAVEVFVILRVLGGLLLFIIPGIRAGLRYQMVYFPVFDEGLNAKNAIKRIKQLTKHHLMEIFGLATVAAIIPVVGLLLSMGGEAVLYPELKALEHSEVQPKVHWLNYLGLILAAVFCLAIAVVIVAIYNLTKLS